MYSLVKKIAFSADIPLLRAKILQDSLYDMNCSEMQKLMKHVVDSRLKDMFPCNISMFVITFL